MKAELHRADFKITPAVRQYVLNVLRDHPLRDSCNYGEVHADELRMVNVVDLTPVTTGDRDRLALIGDARRFFVLSRLLFREVKFHGHATGLTLRRVMELAERIGQEAELAWPPSRRVALPDNGRCVEYRPNGDDSIIVAYSHFSEDPAWTHEPCPFAMKIGKWFFFARGPDSNESVRDPATSSKWAKRWKLGPPYAFQWGVPHLDGHKALPSGVFDVIARSGPIGNPLQYYNNPGWEYILRGVEQNITAMTRTIAGPGEELLIVGRHALDKDEREVLLVALDSALEETGGFTPGLLAGLAVLGLGVALGRKRDRENGVG